MIAVDGSLIDAGVDLVMVIVIQPDAEGMIEVLDRDVFLNVAEEAFPDGAEKSFHFTTRGAVVGF